MPVISEDMVRRAQNGDMEAFGLLYDQYKKMVLRRLFDIGFGLADAEDICHEVFIQAHAKLHTLKHPKLFPAWLKSIARNMGLNLSKPRKSCKIFFEEVECPSNICTVKEAERRENQERVFRALAELQPFDRESLKAFYFSHKSLREMADIFGAPVGTIKRRLFMARSRLRKILQSRRGVA